MDQFEEEKKDFTITMGKLERNDTKHGLLDMGVQAMVWERLPLEDDQRGVFLEALKLERTPLKVVKEDGDQSLYTTPHKAEPQLHNFDFGE